MTNLMSNPNKPKRERQPLIDFTKLNKDQLAVLSAKWHKEAYTLELKYDRALHSNEDVSNLFRMANKLWKRVQILESYITKTR